MRIQTISSILASWEIIKVITLAALFTHNKYHRLKESLQNGRETEHHLHYA